MTAETPSFPTSTVARVVAASPGAVWSIVSDPARFAALYPIHVDGRWTGNRRPGTGADLVFPSEVQGWKYVLRSTIRQWIPELALAFDSGIDDQPRYSLRGISIAPHGDGSLVTFSTSQIAAVTRLKLVARSARVPEATRRTLGMIRAWDRTFLDRLAFTVAVPELDHPAHLRVPVAG